MAFSGAGLRIDPEGSGHQRRLRDLRTRDQHRAHELLPTFVHYEQEIHPVGVRGGLGTPFEGGVGEAIIEVFRQNRVAIHGYVELTEGLAFGGAELREKARLVQRVHAFDLDTVHQELRPLLNVYRHRYIADLAAEIVGCVRGHLDVAESVREVKVGDIVAVALDQIFAIAAVRELQKIRLLQVHALADHVGGEIVDTLNRNFDEPVARSLIYQKVYVGFVVNDFLLLNSTWLSK